MTHLTATWIPSALYHMKGEKKDGIIVKKYKQKKLTCMSGLHVSLNMDICFSRVREPVTMINCSFSAKHKI